MKVLVLGGTGLISQYIVSELVGCKHEVRIYNRGVTAADMPAGVERIVGRRDAIANAREEIGRLGLDCVIDMCGYTEQDAQALIEAVGGIVPQVVFCSTVDVFEKGRGPYPMTEAAPRGARPTFPYAVGKVASELSLQRAAEQGAFALTIIRPGQTYGGPNHGPNHPLGHLGYHLWRLDEGMGIILHGDASSLWSACYAPDVAAAFVAAVGNADAYNRDYNTAGDEVVTWARYWEIAAGAFGGALLDTVAIPTEVLVRIFGEDAYVLVENYQYNNVFDCSRAKDELGFRYTTTLRDGFEWVAKRFGDSWRKEGREERDSMFAARYERCIDWWKQMTDVPCSDR
jgi:nucleoside-diphosphate-sugar epimerase